MFTLLPHSATSMKCPEDNPTLCQIALHHAAGLDPLSSNASRHSEGHRQAASGLHGAVWEVRGQRGNGDRGSLGGQGADGVMVSETVTLVREAEGPWCQRPSRWSGRVQRVPVAMAVKVVRGVQRVLVAEAVKVVRGT